MLHETAEDHGWMYWAEVPALLGCAAWGDTVEDTMRDLWGNARIIIERMKEDGRPLPEERALTNPQGGVTFTE